MLRNGWNFHSDIALVLERIAESYSAPIPSFCADAIESSTFAETMIFLLDQKGSPLLCEEEINAFKEKAYPYLDKSGHQIDPETAQELLNEFRMLMRVGR